MSTEDLLGDALRARVDHTDHPRTPLAEVVSTARRIRRRRRATTAAVAAVVVAVLTTPFVLTAGDRPDSAPDPTPPTPDVRLGDVPLGDPPGVAWLDGSDYVAADGTRTALPLDQVTRATPYDGGFLVTSFGDRRITLLDGRLREVSRRCYAGGGFAVSDDGLRTAYTTSGCDRSDPVLHVGPTGGDGGERTAPLPMVDAGPVGFLGDGVVVNSLNEGPPAIVTPGDSPTRLDVLGTAVDVDERLGLVAGRLAGEPTPEQATSTGAVVDARTGSVRWTAPGWGPLAFSPDGSMVLAGRSGDPLVLAAFDSAAGDRLHELTMPAGVQVWQVGWEDDEHLLVVVSQGRTETILRTTLDGTLERATDTAPYDEDADRRLGLAPNDFP
ncbi:MULTISPECIES: hypothetical protein [unclassified Nocardioides]|uniref:hypothetical protein n=1 Tax=unclassified Nocardioides TaxID=2615069 RepID=UPI00301531EE